jgi:protein TonB
LGLGVEFKTLDAERRTRLFASNIVSASVVGAAFALAVVMHEAVEKAREREMRKISFVQARPKPAPKPELPKPKPPPPKKKPGPKGPDKPVKQRLRAPDRAVAKTLVAPKEIPKVAEKPPEVVEEDTVHLATEGTLDETEGAIGGSIEKPPPGETGTGGGGEGAPVEEPPPKPKPKPKTIFLRADMPKPERIEGTDPAYVEAAKQAGISGLVVLLFTITPDGDVTNVRLIKDLPVLGQVCVKAVRQWKFKQVIYQGQPVSVIVKQPFLFKLED